MSLQNKINDIIIDTPKIFTTNTVEHALNSARQIAEAVCKALIYNEFGKSDGDKIINGYLDNRLRDATDPRTRRPKFVDLNLMTRYISDSESGSEIIRDPEIRSKLRTSLDGIRTYCNPASHNPNRERSTQNELNLVREQIKVSLQHLFKILQQDIPHQIKPYLGATIVPTVAPKPLTDLESFRADLQEWTDALDYTRGEIDLIENRKFYYTIQLRERRSTRSILMVGVTQVIQTPLLTEVERLRQEYDCDESWVVSTKYVSKAAQDIKSFPEVYPYHFDSFIEQDVNFDKYFDWLEREIREKAIDKHYISLGCERKEWDDRTKELKATSQYPSVDAHIQDWLAWAEHEHLSILGDFGTGKTWLLLHIAGELLAEYKRNRANQSPRPRIPILIYLRDFAKAVEVEALISDFFFRKHRIELRGAFKAFASLNRMGKLLLLFDGFDEMADKLDKQKIINNFWELASIVSAKSKLILTSRTEHFQQIKEGRAVLSSESKQTTKSLNPLNPQFGILELQQLTHEQLKNLLNSLTSKQNVEKLLSSAELVKLLRRPIMTHLVLEVAEELELDKPLNLTLLYFYATSRKMNRDISQERTFTSLADKLFFLSELSFQMLANDLLKIHYKGFNRFTEHLFGDRCPNPEIDYWRYDMRGQTILVIDSEDGYYKPAHKSFLEYFVAYRFAAQLGVLDGVFLDAARQQSHIDHTLQPKNYRWSDYFKRKMDANGNIIKIAPLAEFVPEELETLRDGFGARWLNNYEDAASIALMKMFRGMLSLNDNMLEKFWAILDSCRGKSFEEVKYIATNIVLIILSKKEKYFKNKDLSNLCLRQLRDWSCQETNFTHSDLTNSSFAFVSNSNFENANLHGVRWSARRMIFDGMKVENKIISVHYRYNRKLIVLDKNTFKLTNISENIGVDYFNQGVDFNPTFINDLPIKSDKYLVYPTKEKLSVLDLESKEEYDIEKYEHSIRSSRGFCKFYPTNRNLLIYAFNHGNINHCNISFFNCENKQFEAKINCDWVQAVCFTEDAEFLIVATVYQLKIISIHSKIVVEELNFAQLFDREVPNKLFITQLIFDENNLFMLGWILWKIDWQTKKCVDTFMYYGDLRGTNFKNAKGLPDSQKLLLKQNGALF